MIEAQPILLSPPHPVNPRFQNLTARIFSRLLVLQFCGLSKRGNANWLCMCSCGAYRVIEARNLKNRSTRSCGCYHIERLIGRITKYSQCSVSSKSPEYYAWNAMRHRCTDPNTAGFENYGGRGIHVCERWLNSFANFLADMGRRPPGMTLERINNNGNYEPENCKWATQKEQRNNSRQNRWLTFVGIRRTMRQWADLSGIPYPILRTRILRRWVTERALTTPPRRWG